MSLIELRGVTKRFGSNTVLENINIDIPENKIFGLIGINGSGKTTLLRLIIGFYKPDSGVILYDGQKIDKIMSKIKRDFGFTTQDSSFYPKLTVEENIRYFGSLYGLTRKDINENLEKVLPLMDLNHVRDVLAENLSGGMQRRLDMACSLIHVPRVLILDEPTEDLDPLLRRDIMRLIKKINELGTTVIITSHLLDDVETLCNEVAILHKMRVINVGSVEELRHMYNKKEEIHMELMPSDYSNIIKIVELEPEDYIVEDGKMVIYSNEAEHILHKILHVIEEKNMKLLYVDVRKPSLGEVFRFLTSRESQKSPEMPAEKITSEKKLVKK